MTQSTTPNFGDDDAAELAEIEAAATSPVEFNDAADAESDLNLEVEDDANLDVDVPDTDDEVEVIADPAKPAKEKAEKKVSTRVSAPDGYVKPVEFAKLLSEHIGKTVAPQVVYSYVKNNSGDGAKNPFPTHQIGDYAWYIVPQEGYDWWDQKNQRVAAGKQARAEKAAKKAEKADAVTETTTTEAVVEAE